MKNLLLLLLLPMVGFAQLRPVDSDRSAAGYILTNRGVAIVSKSYTSSTVDTTETFNCINQKTLYVGLQANDTTTILVDYALSLDGVTYTAFTTIDSLSAKPANGAASFKNIDFTSTIGGAPYAKFRLSHSAKAYALGVSSPTYTAIFTFKKY